MPEVRFYHLTRNPIEATLPNLLEKSLQRGWRVLVHCTDTKRLEQLDARLWEGPPTSFLPHGSSANDHAAEQPILISTAPENLNNANVLMLVDGAKAAPEVFLTFELSCIFFDGNDEAAVADARQDWKKVIEAGMQAIYWAQDADGRWVKKAES